MMKLWFPILLFAGVAFAQNQTSHYPIDPFDCSYTACPGVGLALPLGAVVSSVTLNQVKSLKFTTETVYCYGAACSIMVDTGAGMVFGPDDQLWVTWTQGTVAAQNKARARPTRKRGR